MASANLQRREFLKYLTMATAGIASSRLMDAARVHAAGRARITDVKLVPLRVEKDLGSYPDWVGNPRHVTVGGGAFLEVHTDQGVTGIGPEMAPALLPQVNAILAGQDPFDINTLATRLYGTGAPGAGYRGSAAAEIALWDLIGKLANQPLYKLWGGGRERVIPYASMLRLSTPQERGEIAARLKAEGWRAIKVRSSFPTLREDVQLVEAIRKTTGDDFIIMCDANKAPFDRATTKGVRWDFTRACQTALEYQRLNVYWLEEPLPRYDYAQLAELNRMIYMKLAGGEGNRGVHEFRDLLDQGCFDIVQPENMLEGPTHLRMISALAQSMDKMCIPHVGDMRLGTVCNLHLIASWPEENSPYIEIFNDQPIGNYTYPFSIFEAPPTLSKDGFFDLPQQPGLGMKIKEDLILRS